MFHGAKSLSGMANQTENEYPVQETGSNYSEAVADLTETMGTNYFTTTGNDLGLNVDVRNVSVWNLCLSEYHPEFLLLKDVL